MADQLVVLLTSKARVSRYIRRLIADQVEGLVERHVQGYVRRYVGTTIAGIEGRFRTLADEMTILGERMTSVEQSEQSRWDEVARVAGLVIAEIASLKTQVEAAVADKEAAVAAGVESALGEEAQRDIERLDALAAKLSEALPVEVPEVPEPPAGEPATDPGSGATSDDVVDGSAPPVEGSGGDGGDVVADGGSDTVNPTEGDDVLDADEIGGPEDAGAGDAATEDVTPQPGTNG